MRGFFLLLFLLLLSSFAFAAGTNYPLPSNPLNASNVWHLDDGSGSTFTDSLGSLDVTSTGGNVWNTSDPQVGTAWVDIALDDATVSSVKTVAGEFSVSFWMKPKATNDVIFGNYGTAPNRGWGLCYGCATGNKLYVYASDDGTNHQPFEFDYTFSLHSTYHVAIKLDKSTNDCQLWVDGAIADTQSCGSGSTIFNNTNTFAIGADESGAQQFDGFLDEIIFFDYFITNNTIGYLYNTTYVFASGSTASFVEPTPSDNDRNNTQVVLNATCSANENIYLYMDENNPPTNLMLTNSSSGLFTTNVTTDNTYYYFAGCDDGSGGVLGNTSVRSWIYDTLSPNIVFSSTSSVNTSNITRNRFDSTLKLHWNFTDNFDLFGHLVNVTQGQTVYFNITNTSMQGTLENFNENLDTTSWPNGEYLIDIMVTDSHTDNEIDEYQTGLFGNKIVYDTPEENRIVIQSQGNSVVSTEKLIDRYTFTFDFTGNNNPTKIFFFTCDNEVNYRPSSAYRGHFTCWNSDTKSGNWIDWELVNNKNLIPTIELVESEPGEPTKYKVTYITNDAILTFNSIGGMNSNRINLLYRKDSISIHNQSITPRFASILDNIYGYLNASTFFNSPLSVDYRWYRNDALYYANSYFTLDNNELTLIDTINKTALTINDTWIFSVKINTTGNSTEWINSTVRDILETHLRTYHIVDPSDFYPSFLETIENVTANTYGLNPFTIDFNDYDPFSDILLSVTDKEGVFPDISFTETLNTSINNVTLRLTSKSFTIAWTNLQTNVLLTSIGSTAGSDSRSYINVHSISANMSEFVQSDESIIKVQFNLDPVSQIWLQEYQFINNIALDTFTVNLTNQGSVINKSAWLRVISPTNAGLDNAVINVYMSNGTTTPDTNFTYSGRYLTDDDGYAKIWVIDGYTVRLEISKDEYSTRTLTKFMSDTYDSLSPLSITLGYLSSATAPLVYSMPNGYISLVNNIPGEVTYANGTVSFNTNYRIEKNQPSEKLNDNIFYQWVWGEVTGETVYYTDNSYPFILQPSIHFNNTVGKDIIVYFYSDGANIGNHTIYYINESELNAYDIGSYSFLDTRKDLFTVLFFILILIMSVLAQFVFTTENDKTGVHTFFIGILLLTLFNSALWVVSVLIITYYFSQPLKKIIGVNI